MLDKGILVILLGLVGLATAIECPKQKTSPGREVVCYTYVSDVEKLTDSICRCTTLIHQGYDVRNLSTSGFESFRKSLKDINPPLQFVISVDDPAKTLRTSGTIRQETAARLIGVLKEVDGLELNMTAGSKERLSHFVKGLKDEMVRKSYEKRLFLVLPTKSEDLAKQFDLKELSKYVDLFTIATHYLVEEDETYHTFHPSRLMGLFDIINTDSLIDLISGLGAPKRKILVSVPASGYRFSLKDQDDNAPRSETVEKLPVVIDRKQLCDSMSRGEWTIERDEDLTAPYAFKNKSWIAFEDEISIGIKGKYALLRDLPGLAIRDVENDRKTKCGNPLTHDVHHSFTDFKRKSRAAVLNALEDDLHQAQFTYSNHVKSSDFRVVRVVDTEGHIRAVRENTQTEFSCTRQGYFVHPKSCNRFYRCVKFNQEVEDYSVFEFDCPAGLAFDEHTEVCVWPGSLSQGSPCPGSSEIAPVTRVRFQCPSESGYYADPQNGRWFFACIDLGGPELMAFEFRCPYGLVFDEQKLVCEWPWLVAGYSGAGYTRSEYDNGGYSGGSTQGTGGYVTGQLPQGSSRFPGSSGGYSGTTAGVSYSSSGYSKSGAGAGRGHSGGSGISGPAGVDYSGSTYGSDGHSFGQEYSSHGAGTTAQSYGGHGGSEYSGSADGSYTGSVGSGYNQGSTGGAYSGSTNGGYFGSTGGTYSIQNGGGSTKTGYSGTSDSIYTGVTGSGHASSGDDYTGAGGNVHTGVIGGSSTGKVGPGYGGSTYNGYQGSTSSSYGGGHAGQTGSTGGAYGGSHVGQTGSSIGGYQGSTSGSYDGSHVIQTGSTSGGYEGATSGYYGGDHGGQAGSTSGSYAGSNVGQTGPSIGGYQGSTSGSYDGGHVIQTGSTLGGYQGSTSGSYDGDHGGQAGSTSGSYAGSNVAQTGSSIGGYQGSTSGSYGGSHVIQTGSSLDGYQGGTSGSYGGDHGGQTGSTSGSYGGSHVIKTGSTLDGYQGTTSGSYGGDHGGQTGSTSGSYGGSHVIKTGSTFDGYQGTTSGSYGGDHGGQTGSTSGSYGGSHVAQTGSSIGGYQGSTSGSYGGSQGSTDGIFAGSPDKSYTGVGTGGYSTGSGYSGSDYSGTSTIGSGYSIGGHSDSGRKEGGYFSSTGGQHPGSSQGPTILGFSTVSDYSGSLGHSDSSGSTYAGQDSAGPGGYSIGLAHSGSIAHSTGSGSTYEGPGTTIQGGYSSGTKYSGSTGVGYTGSSQAGFSVPGQTVQSKVPIYTVTGPAGTGYAGSTNQPGVQGQFPGATLLGQDRGLPSASYIPTTSTIPGYSGHSYVTNQVTGNGVPTSSLFPGQPGVETTYFGNAGVGGFVTYGAGDRSKLNITLIGNDRPSAGRKGYHQGTISTTDYNIGGGSVGTGAIITGGSIQGSITTDDSSSGTLITHGDTAGTVLTGSSDQGAIITGISQPGYTKTGTGTPGYVISGGVKTIYPGSASPGSIVHGTSSPGVTLTGPSVPGVTIKGVSSPGIVFSGQSSPGTSIGGSIEPGTVVGSTGTQYFTDSASSTYYGPGASQTGSPIYDGSKPGTVPVTEDTGYKTNEYHDNGGRGTIKFNNGYVTSKYTENDIPDYRPAGGILPDTLLPVGRAESSTSFGTTLSGIQTQTPGYSVNSDSLTPTGFTKTGPTRTGITTATLGGRGRYVVSTGKPLSTINSDKIGEKAFEGNVAGYTKTSTEAPDYYGVTSTQSGDLSHIDTSKITLGPTQSTGYSYPQPSVQFETGPSSSSPLSSTEGSIYPTTTPEPYLNIQVYNTPKVVDSAPITASPAVVNTYTYNKPGDGQYRGDTSSRVPTGFTRKPVPTVSPVLYTTGPLENYKTTAFEAAKIPVVVSTVQPVLDTGYKTIVSPTGIPVTVTQDKFGSNVQTGSISTHSQFDLGIDTSLQDGGFGSKINYVPSTTPSSIGVPAVTYGLPSVTVQPQTNYIPSTTSPEPGYSYGTPKATFGQSVTSSSISESLKPQTQYLPSEPISPAIGVTYRKPFPVSGITYQQSTPQPSLAPVTSKTYSYSSSSYAGQGFTTESRNTIGSNTGGSPTNLGISRDEVGKLITNYNRGTTKYVPSEYDTYTGTDFSRTTGSFGDFSRTAGSFGDFSRKQTSSSSSFGQTYGTPTVSSISGSQRPLTVTAYPSGYSKPSVSSYEVTTQTAVTKGKGKVIVKWSDLHPLLLGKLGAECTCKADPFANLRGPGKKLISSSKGQVDLSNYDESEVYVDLEKNESYDDGDYVTTYDTSSPQPVKIWNEETPVPLLDGKSQSRDKPLSTYLPAVSSTVAPSRNLGVHNQFEASKEDNYGSSLSNRGYTLSQRSGKNLNIAAPTPNSIAGQGASFDRYGPGGLRGPDEILEGATDCARPGLFRHPNFCNKFYACHWDEWKKKFTLHVFNCPVHLTFDNSAGACNWPSKGPACQDDNLLV